jgi:hypothetical protein
MRAQPRRSLADLNKADIPTDPGVYSFFRKGMPIYVGKALSLQDRIWTKHLSRSRSMHTSAFRRNVADDEFGIAKADDIYHRRYRLSADELARVRSWIEGCEVAWISRPSEPDAVALETVMKAEWLPPLTRV